MEIQELFKKLAQIEQIEARLITIQQLLEGKSEDEIGGIELAVKVSNLSKARIYQLVSNRLIPFHKVPGISRLYFRKSELEQHFAPKAKQ